MRLSMRLSGRTVVRLLGTWSQGSQVPGVCRLTGIADVLGLASQWRTVSGELAVAEVGVPGRAERLLGLDLLAAGLAGRLGLSVQITH